MLSSIIPATFTYPPNGMIDKQYSVPEPFLPSRFIFVLITGCHLKDPLSSFLKKNKLTFQPPGMEVKVPNLGGNPTENLSTFTPIDLAAR